jgi:hypothetical protein
MSWWLIPVLIIVIIAGIGAGLLVSYFILKSQNKSFPLFKNKELATQDVESAQPPASKPVVFTVEPRKEKAVEKQAQSVTLAENALEEYIAKKESSQAVITPEAPEIRSQPAESPVASLKSAALIELEINLEIATRPAVEKLPSFQTEVWNNRRSEFSLNNSQLLGELTEAYVDMLLANNIVWLVTELGRDSPDLRASYSDLKTKVADRLKRVMPSLK